MEEMPQQTQFSLFLEAASQSDLLRYIGKDRKNACLEILLLYDF